ncbi:unnamed protein product [Arctogadus glacialis]
MAPPVNVTITPGSDTTTTGNTTTMSENKTTTPGIKTTTPGNKTPTSNNVTPTPDNKAIELSNNTDMQGYTEVFPTVLFLKSIPPIHCKKVSMPSNTPTVPGSTAVPGDKMTTPGNKTATPGSDTTTTGNTSTMSENKRTTPDNKAATPGNKMAPHVNVTIPPGSNTTTTGNTTTMSENKTPTSDNKTPTSDNITPTPDNKKVKLSNNKVTRGYTEVFPTVLFLESIQCLDVQCWTWKEFLSYATRGATIMVTDLPEIEYDAYTASSITHALGNFGSIQCDKCFILPDNCTAFLTMTANSLASLIEALVMEASLNFETLRFHILKENALESPITFYKHLLRWRERVTRTHSHCHCNLGHHNLHSS